MAATITIIEQVSPTEVIVHCARCKGSGRKWPNDSDSSPCWVCNGKGRVLLEVERLPLVPCARCKGTGRKWPNDSDSKECIACRGAGCQPIAGHWDLVS
jgi:DnaJ-class molecular chaperone